MCHTEEEYRAYFERSKRGIWLGDWDIPTDLEHLIQHMLRIDPVKRYTAMEAYHHPSLRLTAPDVIITPHFVRAAASFDAPEPVPVKPKKKAPSGRSTPLPLGESIKQHTAKASPKRLVIKKIRSVEGLADTDDPTRKFKVITLTTATKVLKPAQPLQQITLRPSHKNLRLARTESMASLDKENQPIRTSSLQRKDLKSVRSLEGLKKRDVLGAITRPAPEPPRPASALNKEESRSPSAQLTTAPIKPQIVRTLSQNMSPASVGSPPRKRLAKPAVPIQNDPPRLSHSSIVEKSPLRDVKDHINQNTIDTRLDQLSDWVKSVEAIVQEARKALAEGRELPLPTLNLPALHTEHLRTESTQVEAGTPPKWMTQAEIGATVERHSVPNVLTLIDKKEHRASTRKFYMFPADPSRHARPS